MIEDFGDVRRSIYGLPQEIECDIQVGASETGQAIIDVQNSPFWEGYSKKALDVVEALGWLFWLLGMNDWEGGDSATFNVLCPGAMGLRYETD